MVAKIVMECGHCGKHAEFKVRGQYTDDRTPSEDSWGYAPFIDKTVWRLLECAQCSMPTLEQTRYTQSNDSLVDENFPREGKMVRTILYPLASRLNNLYPIVEVGPKTNLPKDIESVYKDALRARNKDPRACALYIGLTLEAICKHENTQGKNLADRLKYLSDCGRLPKALAEMARQSRLIRNLGVHMTQDRVTQADVLVILEFLEIILDYLYIVPAKIAAVEMRLRAKNPFFLMD